MVGNKNPRRSGFAGGCCIDKRRVKANGDDNSRFNSHNYFYHTTNVPQNHNSGKKMARKA